MIILLFAAKLALKILLMPKQLNLYSTSHCHLCDLAYAMVMQIKVSINVNISVTDILDDEILLANYGLRIPVLQRLDTRAELNWPFSENDILEFLK